MYINETTKEEYSTELVARSEADKFAERERATLRNNPKPDDLLIMQQAGDVYEYWCFMGDLPIGYAPQWIDGWIAHLSAYKTLLADDYIEQLKKIDKNNPVSYEFAHLSALIKSYVQGRWIDWVNTFAIEVRESSNGDIEVCQENESFPLLVISKQ